MSQLSHAAPTEDRSDIPPTPPVELLRVLAVLAEPPSPEYARVAEAAGLGPAPTASEHGDVFLFQLYPYASVHVGAEGMMGGEARDRLAGFWRALAFALTLTPTLTLTSTMRGNRSRAALARASGCQKRPRKSSSPGRKILSIQRRYVLSPTRSIALESSMMTRAWRSTSRPSGKSRRPPERA